MARVRLPQAACCAVQGVGHDVSPCSGPLGAALGSGGAWRGARLLPGLQYGRYPSRFADILRDSRFRTPISFAILGRVHLVSCAAHGPPLAAHQCVTPLAIFSWLAKQDRIERELSTTRLYLSQLQNKSSQPPVPIYSSTVCNTGIQYLSRFAERYLSRFAFRIFFPPKRLYMSVVTCHSSQMRVVPFSIYGASEATTDEHDIQRDLSNSPVNPCGKVVERPQRLPRTRRRLVAKAIARPTMAALSR